MLPSTGAIMSLLLLKAFAHLEPHLHLTALISDHDGKAQFECWEMAVPFTSYPTVGDGITGLADVTNISYVVLPPRSSEGLHKPPHAMFFVLLSGLAHVTLPECNDELWIMEGVNGLMIAADTMGDGHFTEYPSDKPSVALQLPFKDGRLPAHRTLGPGPCNSKINGQYQIVVPRKDQDVFARGLS